MTKPAAIMGTFADVQSIRTRSVAVLKIEVPIEMMDEALLALGGWPQPGAEKAVAVALLVQDAKPVKEPKATVVSMQAKERYANSDEMSQARTRAVMLCKDADFQFFIGVDKMEMNAGAEVGERQAGINLCARIGILSRSDIGKSPDAYHAFRKIEDRFRAAQQAAGHSPAVTGVQP